MTATARPAVLIYAALSKASRHHSDDAQPDEERETSIGSQVAAIRARLEQVYPDGFDVIGPNSSVDYFADDGYSGSKRDRGPSLQAAITAAKEAAATREVCEIWVNTSTRFGRGTGTRDGSRAVGALYYDLRAAGVDMRAVKDDDFVRNEMLVGFASKMASKYSEDLSESVSRAKLVQLARGEHLGGPVADGYTLLREHDARGREISRVYAPDDDRAAVVRRIFKLAEEGVSDTHIARRLNVEGVKTRLGNAYDRRAVQNMVTNPIYAGRIAYKRGTPDERIVEGRHPALVEPTVFDRIQRARTRRDYSPRKHTIGRPVKNHALSKLATCSRCDAPMGSHTSTYQRKDGTRARTYVCSNAKRGVGLCDARPINAEVVDAAVIARLDELVIDFGDWRKRIERSHDDEREQLRREVERAQSDLEDQRRRAEKVQAKWSDYIANDDDAKADLALPMVEAERAKVAQAERRLQATQDAFSSVPTLAPADAMLDFANTLQRAVRGRIEKATGAMGDVNLALRELFAEFRLEEIPWHGGFVDAEDGGLKTAHPGRRGVWIAPIVKPEVFSAMSDERLATMSVGEWPTIVPTVGNAEPPQWAHAAQTGSSHPDENEQNSQLYRRRKPNRRPLAASQP